MAHTVLPPKITISELAEFLGVPERTARERAQRLGIYIKPGQGVGFILARDLNLILEDAVCPSPSSSAAASGTTAEQLPAGDYAALRERLTRPTRKESRRKSKAAPGNVVSMVQGPA